MVVTIPFSQCVKLGLGIVVGGTLVPLIAGAVVFGAYTIFEQGRKAKPLRDSEGK